MNTIYKKFYKEFYSKTGFIPANTLHLTMFPGDLFQIRNNEIVLLGNIYRNGVVDVEEASIEKNIEYNAANWNMSNGVSKHYLGRETEHQSEGEFEFTKQLLVFNALAGSPKGELELMTKTENSDLVDLFGSSDTKTVQSKDIEYYQRDVNRNLNFFKAKKLTVRDDQNEPLIADLLKDNVDGEKWLHIFMDEKVEFNPAEDASRLSNMNQLNILDKLQANQLNPNTALSYFTWNNADLDDIEQLFR